MRGLELGIASLFFSTALLADTPSPSPLGVNWGATYGFGPAKAQPFVPQARKLGASFSRVMLYWSQLEPKEGVSRWTDLDAYTSQISSPDEAIVTLASASPWATRTKTWVFPSSPAADPAKYTAFVRSVVQHLNGKVRYFQSDNEPNNPFFWSGTAEEFAAQQQLFYRAVKDADSSAAVILGGCDGLFDPTNTDPIPNQEGDVAFWKKVLASAGNSFDVFDLHLYGNPYTIPDRVAAVREMMRWAGSEKPIIAAEYHGPGFFDFKANRRWWQTLRGSAASPDAVRRLREQGAALPVETKMFLEPQNPANAERLVRLQSEDIVVRNLLALSSGVQRTAFFDLWHDSTNPDAPNTVLDGTFKLLEHDADGALTKEQPLAVTFRRLSEALAGQTRIARIAVSGQPDVYAFAIDRARRAPLLVIWRRPASVGDAADPLAIHLPWERKAGHAITAMGDKAEFTQDKSGLHLKITDMPILID